MVPEVAFVLVTGMEVAVEAGVAEAANAAGVVEFEVAAAVERLEVEDEIVAVAKFAVEGVALEVDLEADLEASAVVL